MSRTVVVTDSTASLPEDLAAAHGITVVPLQVVVGATPYEEGAEGATPDTVAEALREFVPVSTSRPAPAVMLEVYERLAAAGATEIVSVHLSSEMSGTYESAQLAAQQASVPVVPVDSRQVGIATGFAVLTAAEVVAAGGDAAQRPRRPAAVPRPRRRCSTSTPSSTCDAAAGSAPQRRCWAARSRSSRCWPSRTAGWSTASGYVRRGGARATGGAGRRARR